MRRLKHFSFEHELQEKSTVGPLRFELRLLPPQGEVYRSKIDEKSVKEYLDYVELSGVSKRYLEVVKILLYKFLKTVKYSIEKEVVIEYLKDVQRKSSLAYYRKQMCQIRKFLRFLKIPWVDDLKLPPMPRYQPIIVTDDDIKNTLAFFKGHPQELQLNALVCLGMDSGMRPEEIYQLKIKDIDINNRVVYINHNPRNGQTTKTRESRISFFTMNTASVLQQYIEWFNSQSKVKDLFGRSHILRCFHDSPIQVKYLRKYFSSKWEQRNGNHQIKERLMGHSLNSVDARHYSYVSTGNMHEIYDSVMNKFEYT